MALLDDIGSALTTAGLVGGATGWTLYKSYFPDKPDQVVGLFETGGDDPDLTEGTKYDMPSFQVRVRGQEFEYDTARTKIEAVFSTLHDATVSGYIFVFAVNSGPIPLGYDKNNRPDLSWNFQTMKAR